MLDHPSDPPFLPDATIIGLGSVGQLFAAALSEFGVYLKGVDSRPTEANVDEFVQMDVYDLDKAAIDKILDSKVIVIALPVAPAVAVASFITKLSPRKLIVDTTSVKAPVADVLRNSDVESLTIAPMFAPDLGFYRQKVVYASIRSGPLTAAFLSFLRATGAIVIPANVDEIDDAALIVQTMTHATLLAFGITQQVVQADCKTLLRLAPPPYRVMLAVLARIASAAPAVYHDIQFINPRAPQIRSALKSAIDRIEANDSEPGFGSIMADISEFLGDQRTPMANLCSEIFRDLPNG